MTLTAEHAAIPRPSAVTLDLNLTAMERLSPDAARAIYASAPRAGLEWVVTEESGAASASIDGRWLASRRKPLEEATRLADTVNIKERAGVVVLGFGIGHHVEAISRRIARTGVVVVFEPDVALLRSVFERIDCSRWMRESNVVILTDEADGAVMNSAMSGAESLLAMGTQIVAHAASAPRLGDKAALFGQNFARVVSALRTSLVTTLVQTETTIRNLLMNVGAYAVSPGVTDLAGACLGRPAVVVSAGPSLARNIRVLAEPGVRDRCVIVAVQTALKPLLEAGVRPHYVTALDHHEISARFYEGLTPSMVEGVTLIAEPKANPRILDSFPGAIRCPRDEFLERLLGEEIDPPGERGGVPPGATVAHLAYHVTRLLGCDPVALIGQDLGFTDGQYYAAGAAIHSVWAAELNPFRTIEMFEWERIARARGMLREATDHLGRRVYSDEQMMTYLAQFESMFREDESKGLLTIDATEGGVSKAHTERSTLRDFLGMYATEPCSPPSAKRREGGPDAQTLGALRRRLREVRSGVWRVGDLSRRADTLLEAMLDHQGDHQKVNSLIERVYALRDEALALTPAYNLTQRFNQTGTFKRAKADRVIGLDEEGGADEQATQKARIERDRQNLRWLADSADALGGLMDHSVRSLDGAPKLTRDIVETGPSEDDDAPTKTTVAAMMLVQTQRGALGGPRALRPAGGPLAGRSLLRMTLERLARVEGLENAVLLTDDPEGVRDLVGGTVAGLDVRVERVESSTLGRRAEGVRTCRAWAPSCWRGALGGLTVYDELLDPVAMASAMDRLGINAALLVGPDWPCVDPALTGAVIGRHRERPDKHRLAFSQAAPGLCGMVVDAHVMRDIAEASSPGKAGAFASLGGLLGYVPVSPKADPIAQPVCVPAPPSVRDAGLRFIMDTTGGRAAVEAAAAELGDAFGAADASAIVEAAQRKGIDLPPRHVIVEATTERATGGRRAEWARAGAWRGERTGRLTAGDVRGAVGPIAAARDDVVVSFDGAGDAALAEDLPALVAAARECGAMSVHVRTDLAGDARVVDRLFAAKPDVISVDVLAQRSETYEALTGGGSLTDVVARLQKLLDLRATDGPDAWLRAPFIVPRMTRCDAVYEEVESFYDQGSLACGHAALDPLPPGCASPSERIQPLPPPPAAMAREAAETLIVLCDGTVVRHGTDPAGAPADARSNGGAR